jgi:D-3-phosphoglycerate dehydrogenase
MLPHIDRFINIFNYFNLDLLIPDVDERLSEEEIMIFSGKFDGTICGDDRYSARVINSCVPRLKVISKWGTGIDSIDLDTALRLGVKVYNTPNAFTVPVADSVIGYMLAFARQLPWLDKEMKSGRWHKLLGKALNECTLGVIGVGNVGKAVLQRAHTFGMTLLGNDIVEINNDFLNTFDIEMTDLNDLLTRSDFISVNCTLNPTSYHLLNSANLSNCKKEAVIINVARGPIIEEKALINLLLNGKLKGAALDVFEIEPLPKESTLLKLDNVMLAPHNANSSPSCWEHVHWNTIKNLLNGLDIFINEISDLKRLQLP